MARFPRRRRGEHKGGLIVMLQRYAQAMITFAVAGGVLYAAFTHFATAADVDKKFKEVTHQIERTSLSSDKARYEDELFRLRQEPPTAKNRALIERFQNKLDDANARLRDLQNSRLRDLENRK